MKNYKMEGYKATTAFSGIGVFGFIYGIENKVLYLIHQNKTGGAKMKIKRKIYGALSIAILILLFGIVGGMEHNDLNLKAGIIWMVILIPCLWIFSSPWWR